MKDKDLSLDEIVRKICYMCNKTYPEDVGIIDCSHYQCNMIKTIINKFE